MEFLTQIEMDEGDSTIASLSVWDTNSESYVCLATCTNKEVADIIVKAFKACEKESDENVTDALSKVVAKVA